VGVSSFLQVLRTTQSCPSLTLPALEDLLVPSSSSRGRIAACGRAVVLVKELRTGAFSPSPVHPASPPTGPVLQPSEHPKQNHRIPVWWGLAGTSVGHPAQPPAQAGSPTAGCTAPRPGGAGISPEMETPQPPWAAWARALSPSEGRSSSSCSPGASSASVCARCPLSCHWAP